VPAKRVAVIGNGKMAVDCIKILKSTPGLELTFVLTEPKAVTPSNSLPAYCSRENIPFVETDKINAPEMVAALRERRPDVILNINSFKIIRPAILAIPPEGVINFHNGPLPRYGGVNVCSWAIINGESQHGVTWHYVDEGIDTGAIVAQRCFDLAPAETAVSLIMKCISTGTALFREWLPRLADGTLTGQVQDASQASYFSLKDIPNGGWISFEWTYPEFDRYMRGLSFHPIANTFVYAKTSYRGRPFYVQGFEQLTESPPSKPGTVVAVAPEQIVVAIKDATVALKELLDDEKNAIAADELALRYGIAAGAKLGS